MYPSVQRIRGQHVFVYNFIFLKNCVELKKYGLHERMLFMDVCEGIEQLGRDD
jgi:hypothetical protein